VTPHLSKICVLLSGKKTAKDWAFLAVVLMLLRRDPQQRPNEQ
jgi:hypothetical protein